MSILQELNDEGMTLVVVTHDWRIASYGKRLVELQDGQIVGDRQIGPAERRLRPGVREVAGVEDGEQAPAGCQPEPGAGHEAAPGA
jgi:energy-coupling factor transporter ATP-binding protein EcfA2